MRVCPVGDDVRQQGRNILILRRNLMCAPGVPHICYIRSSVPRIVLTSSIIAVYSFVLAVVEVVNVAQIAAGDFLVKARAYR